MYTCVMHYLNNWGRFEMGPSCFTTAMVLRMPACLATMGQLNVFCIIGQLTSQIICCKN